MEEQDKKTPENQVGKDKRELTEAEKKRVENFNKIVAELEGSGYKRVDLTISLITANTVGLLATLPFIAIVIALYVLHNGTDIYGGFETMPWPVPVSFIIVIVIMAVGIVVHEGIHGLFWSFGTKNHLKDIEFGFVVQMLTPYCTCKVPLSKPIYILGSMMPMTILGFIPGIICVFLANPILMIFSVIMILGGAGDILISALLFKHRTKGKKVVILDHPYECGLVVFEKDK
ncbi:MAG: DUF3267 domain-containing protein [Saccharofermentans sp.]|nr:DUF3267 domain-containing protein [Saccharofermentans sp.]